MAFSASLQEECYISKTTFAENAKLLNEKLSLLLKKQENGYIVNSREILINKGVIKYSTIAEIAKNVFKCPRCQEHFLRGVFFSCGTVNSPEKGHRLDLNFSVYDNAIDFKKYMLDNCIKFNVTIRAKKTVLYM